MVIEMGNGRENNEIEIDLVEVLHILLERIWLILGMGLFLALVCFIFSKFVLTPTYESTTKIYILNKTGETSVTYSDVQMGTQLTKDYAELINSRYVLEEVIQKLGLETEYRDLLKQVRVNTPIDTRIVSITVADIEPAQAMMVANCIREVASNHIQTVMDIEAVNVVESANMPTVKATPNVARWTFFGGVVGVAGVCIMILMQYAMDDTIKSSEDVEKYLSLSTLALIPIVSDGDKAKVKGRPKKVKRK